MSVASCYLWTCKTMARCCCMRISRINSIKIDLVVIKIKSICAMFDFWLKDWLRQKANLIVIKIDSICATMRYYQLGRLDTTLLTRSCAMFHLIYLLILPCSSNRVVSLMSTIVTPYHLTFTVMLVSCPDLRIWTCGTRLFLLTWAGWGLGTRVQ